MSGFLGNIVGGGGGSGDAVTLQGNDISNTTPNDKEALVWNEVTNQWEPTVLYPVITQLDWYIDPISGDDTNDGSIGSPLLSWAGLMKKWGPKPVLDAGVQATFIVNIISDLAENDVIILHDIMLAVMTDLHIIGPAPTVIHSGTSTGGGANTPTTQSYFEDNQYTWPDIDLPYSSNSPNVGSKKTEYGKYLLRYLSPIGGNIYTCFAVKNIDANTVTTSNQAYQRRDEGYEQSEINTFYWSGFNGPGQNYTVETLSPCQISINNIKILNINYLNGYDPERQYDRSRIFIKNFDITNIAQIKNVEIPIRFEIVRFSYAIKTNGTLYDCSAYISNCFEVNFYCCSGYSLSLDNCIGPVKILGCAFETVTANTQLYIDWHYGSVIHTYTASQISAGLFDSENTTANLLVSDGSVYIGELYGTTSSMSGIWLGYEASGKNDTNAINIGLNIPNQNGATVIIRGAVPSFTGTQYAFGVSQSFQSDWYKAVAWNAINQVWTSPRNATWENLGSDISVGGFSNGAFFIPENCKVILENYVGQDQNLPVIPNLFDVTALPESTSVIGTDLAYVVDSNVPSQITISNLTSSIVTEIIASGLDTDLGIKAFNQTITQADWYIDPVGGDDTNDGSNGNPLQTWAGLLAIFGKQAIIDPVGGTMNIYIASDMPSSDPISITDWSVISLGITINILGATLSPLSSGTFTAATAIDESNNQFNEVTDTNAADNWYDTEGFPARITSNGNTAWRYEGLTAKSCSIGGYGLFGTDSYTVDNLVKCYIKEISNIIGINYFFTLFIQDLDIMTDEIIISNNKMTDVWFNKCRIRGIALCTNNHEGDYTVDFEFSYINKLIGYNSANIYLYTTIVNSGSIYYSHIITDGGNIFTDLTAESNSKIYLRYENAITGTIYLSDGSTMTTLTPPNWNDAGYNYLYSNSGSNGFIDLKNNSSLLLTKPGDTPPTTIYLAKSPGFKIGNYTNAFPFDASTGAYKTVSVVCSWTNLATNLAGSGFGNGAFNIADGSKVILGTDEDIGT